MPHVTKIRHMRTKIRHVDATFCIFNGAFRRLGAVASLFLETKTAFHIRDFQGTVETTVNSHFFAATANSRFKTSRAHNFAILGWARRFGPKKHAKIRSRKDYMSQSFNLREDSVNAKFWSS